MDIDDRTVFSDALELHYIDMKAFVKNINEKSGFGEGETLDSMLTKWLTVITEKDIEDKTIIKNICEEQEEISMAVSELVRLSEDKITRQAYQKRQDEIMLYNKRLNDYINMRHIAEQERHRAEQAEAEIKQEKLRAEQERHRAEQERHVAKQERHRAEQAEAEIEKLRARLAELEDNKPVR